MEPVGARIRRLREKQGLSLSELARLSGVSKGYLSQVERSPEARPSASTLFALARALGTSAAALLGTAEAATAAETAEPEVPASLREFAAEAGLPPAEVRMLARIRYRGESPRTADDWRFVYESIRRSVRDR
ncbi:MAG: helix-turn-helix transcriptional regulator [Chloroflexi bacterium]|nr:helix-turn-helix transcriptional regulator [Chloroflexota bacterium]